MLSFFLKRSVYWKKLAVWLVGHQIKKIIVQLWPGALFKFLIFIPHFDKKLSDFVIQSGSKFNYKVTHLKGVCISVTSYR